MAINPKGLDTLERANVKEQALKAKANMEEYFKKSSRYSQDKEIMDLLGVNTTKKEIVDSSPVSDEIEASEKDTSSSKTTKQEKKTDGKKSKG